MEPTEFSNTPTDFSDEPSLWPSSNPSYVPSLWPSSDPSYEPSLWPSSNPSYVPSLLPSSVPSSHFPSSTPSYRPTANPTTEEEGFVKSTDTQIIQETFVVYGSIYFWIFFIFCFVRRRYNKYFSIRSWVTEHYTPLAARETRTYGVFSWTWAVFRVSDDELLEHCGMDALCFLRSLRMGSKICAFGVFNSIWLIPTFMSAESSVETDYLTDYFVRMSIAHLPISSPRFAGPVLASYLITLYGLRLVHREYDWYIEYRHKFMRARTPRNYTVYVSSIPEQFRSNYGLTSYFSQNAAWSAASVVVESNIAMDVPSLEAKVTRRNTVIQKLEYALALKQIKGVTAVHRAINVPLVDEVEKQTNRLVKRTSQVILQKQPDDTPPKSPTRRRRRKAENDTQQILETMESIPTFEDELNYLNEKIASKIQQIRSLHDSTRLKQSRNSRMMMAAASSKMASRRIKKLFDEDLDGDVALMPANSSQTDLIPIPELQHLQPLNESFADDEEMIFVPDAGINVLHEEEKEDYSRSLSSSFHSAVQSDSQRTPDDDDEGDHGQIQLHMPDDILQKMSVEMPAESKSDPFETRQTSSESDDTSENLVFDGREQKAGQYHSNEVSQYAPAHLVADDSVVLDNNDQQQPVDTQQQADDQHQADDSEQTDNQHQVDTQQDADGQGQVDGTLRHVPYQLSEASNNDDHYKCEHENEEIETVTGAAAATATTHDHVDHEITDEVWKKESDVQPFSQEAIGDPILDNGCVSREGLVKLNDCEGEISKSTFSLQSNGSSRGEVSIASASTEITGPRAKTDRRASYTQRLGNRKQRPSNRSNKSDKSDPNSGRSMRSDSSTSRAMSNVAATASATKAVVGTAMARSAGAARNIAVSGGNTIKKSTKTALASGSKAVATTTGHMAENIKRVGANVESGAHMLKDSAAAIAPVFRRMGNGQPRTAGFVTFRDLYTTNAAIQMLQYPTSNRMLIDPAPAPEEVFWPNIGLPGKAKRTGSLFSLAATAVLCFFWSIPTTFLSSLTEVNSIKEGLPALSNFIDRYPFFENALALLAPLFLLILNEALLPAVLEHFSKWEGHIGRPTLESAVFNKLATFMLIQTFFVSAITGTVSAEIGNILDNPEDLVTLLANSLPAQSSYFIQISFVYTFLIHGLELLRVLPLGLAFARQFVGPRLTEKQRRKSFFFVRSLEDPMEFKHAETTAQLVLFFVVFFVYSPIAPITCIFLLICFMICESGYRYHFIHNHKTRPDSGGKIWRGLIRVYFASMIIGVLTLMGYLILRDTLYAVPALVPLLVVIILYMLTIGPKKLHVAMHLPTQFCTETDQENECEGSPDFSFVRGAYLQPALRDPYLYPNDPELELPNKEVTAI